MFNLTIQENEDFTLFIHMNSQYQNLTFNFLFKK